MLIAVLAMAQPATYGWTTPSKNSSESMPCGGGDIGMNVWVENGDNSPPQEQSFQDSLKSCTLNQC